MLLLQAKCHILQKNDTLHLKFKFFLSFFLFFLTCNSIFKESENLWLAYIILYFSLLNWKLLPKAQTVPQNLLQCRLKVVKKFLRNVAVLRSLHTDKCWVNCFCLQHNFNFVLFFIKFDSFIFQKVLCLASLNNVSSMLIN